MPTLDQLRAEVDKEFAPYIIPLSDGTEVALRNPLRLNPSARKKIQENLKAISDDNVDMNTIAELCSEVLLTVGDEGVEKLLEAIDGDAALLIHVIQGWTGATQLGEASNSPDSSTSTASS